MLKNSDPIYLSWQSLDDRGWHVVGRLVRDELGYVFNYTKGVLKAKKFLPFSGMDELATTYRSASLFPLFQNRVLSPKRPEYPRFIKWLGLTESQADPLEILARSEGHRATDWLQTFKRITEDSQGRFVHYFLVHGIRHLSVSALDRVNKLSVGERLCLMLDCQNQLDRRAIVVRAENPAEIVGYCPRYIVNDLHNRLVCEPGSLEVAVETFAPDAPTYYKLMCKLVGKPCRVSATESQERFDEYDLVTCSDGVC